MYTHTTHSIEIGQSRISWSPPNLVDIRFGPSLSVEEIRELVLYLRRISTEHGSCELVADMSMLHELSMAAREKTMDLKLDGILKGIAFIGTQFAVRVTVEMLFRAYHLLHGSSDPFFPYAFVRDREEALRWIASLRPSP